MIMTEERQQTYKIKSVVNRVIYYNKDSGWGVFTITNEGQVPFIEDVELKVSGNFPEIYEECEVQFTSHLVDNPKYGKQLQVNVLEVVQDMKSKASIINFLTKSAISGISVKNAKKVYDRFGKESIEIVLHDTEKLTDIKGIKQKTYEKIKTSVDQYKAMEPLIKYCTELGISYNIINKLYKAKGSEALDIIRTNPYFLLEVTDTFTFSQVDEIATKSGIDAKDDRRLTTGLTYVLKEESILRGSTGCNTQELSRSFLRALKINDTNLYQYALNLLVSNRTVVLEYSNVYLTEFFNAEKHIAEFILYNVSEINVKERYREYIIDEEINNFGKIQLNEQQVHAVRSCLANKFNVITSLGGCGKTVITKAIVNILKRHDEKVILLSPTGKAAKRLEECTFTPTQTIHRFIKAKEGEDLIDKQVKTKVPHKATVIIDEASMTDVVLLKKVLEACNDDTRIILVGDTHQLPSIQAGNVLEDIINSDKVNVCTLTQIMRQADNSNIVKYCADVNAGVNLDHPIKTKDFIHVRYFNKDKLLEDILTVYKKAVAKFGLSEVQVLSIYKKGLLGVTNLNKCLKEAVNSVETNEIFDFSVGDKVKHNKNNYDKEIFNGETGIVTDISLASNDDNFFAEDTLTVNYGTKKDPRYVLYDKTDVNEIQLAFASTVHAAQGSEYDAVIVVLDNEVSNILLVRKLLYTALSRAKEKCILCSTEDCANTAVQNNFYKKRITKLYDFLVGDEIDGII